MLSLGFSSSSKKMLWQEQYCSRFHFACCPIAQMIEKKYEAQKAGDGEARDSIQ